MIRVVLVDDQDLVRAGVRTLLEHAEDITVVAEAANGREGVAAVREHHAVGARGFHQPAVELFLIQAAVFDRDRNVTGNGPQYLKVFR